METFLRYWPFVRGIHRSPVNSPYKGQWRGQGWGEYTNPEYEYEYEYFA